MVTPKYINVLYWVYSSLIQGLKLFSRLDNRFSRIDNILSRLGNIFSKSDSCFIIGFSYFCIGYENVLYLGERSFRKGMKMKLCVVWRHFCCTFS